MAPAHSLCHAAAFPCGSICCVAPRCEGSCHRQSWRNSEQTPAPAPLAMLDTGTRWAATRGPTAVYDHPRLRPGCRTCSMWPLSFGVVTMSSSGYGSVHFRSLHLSRCSSPSVCEPWPQHAAAAACGASAASSPALVAAHTLRCLRGLLARPLACVAWSKAARRAAPHPHKAAEEQPHRPGPVACVHPRQRHAQVPSGSVLQNSGRGPGSTLRSQDHHGRKQPPPLLAEYPANTTLTHRHLRKPTPVCWFDEHSSSWSSMPHRAEACGQRINTSRGGVGVSTGRINPCVASAQDGTDVCAGGPFADTLATGRRAEARYA